MRTKYLLFFLIIALFFSLASTEETYAIDLLSRISTDSSGSEANGASGVPSISSDSRYIAFSSSASDLVASDTNIQSDVFLKDTQTGLLCNR